MTSHQGNLIPFEARRQARDRHAALAAEPVNEPPAQRRVARPSGQCKSTSRPDPMLVDPALALKKRGDAIFRYVVWNPLTPRVTQALTAPALQLLPNLVVGNLASTNPASLEVSTRLRLREFLTATQTGSELVFTRGTLRLSMAGPQEVRLVDLKFSVRVLNALTGASIFTLHDLLEATPNKLLSLKNFGVACLDEVEGVLGRMGFTPSGAETPFRTLSPEYDPAPAGYPFAGLLTVHDALPEGRLRNKLAEAGQLTMGEIAVLGEAERAARLNLTQDEETLIASLLDRLGLVSAASVTNRPAWVAAHLPDIRRAFHPELKALSEAVQSGEGALRAWSSIFRMDSQHLLAELELLIPANYDWRKRDVITALFGLDGSDPLTLEEVARQQSPATSRERIRQIASPFLDALAFHGSKLAFLDRALALLVQESPCTQAHAETRLTECGVLRARLSVASLLKLLDRAGFHHNLELRSGVLLTTRFATRLAASVSRARRICARWGVADWHEVDSGVHVSGELVRALLPEVTWLEGSDRYFVFPQANNLIANRLARLLRVSPRIAVSSAYEAICRDPRVDPDRLPQELFPAFCEAWSWCSLHGEHLVLVGERAEGPQLAATSVESYLVSLLREFGRPVTRREILRRTRQEDIADASVYPALRHSSFLIESTGLYSVIGETQRLESTG